MSPPARVAPQLLLCEVAAEQCLRAFRTIRVPEIGDPDLPLSFRSHYEEGFEARLRQTQHSALHVAVSFWRNQETCLALAKRYPKHGGYVAEVLLTFGWGIDYLDPAQEVDPQHLTIWASPASLARAVVGIVPVES